MQDRYFIEYRTPTSDWMLAETDESRATPESVDAAAAYILAHEALTGGTEYRVLKVQPDAMPRDVTSDVLRACAYLTLARDGSSEPFPRFLEDYEDIREENETAAREFIEDVRISHEIAIGAR